MPTAGPRFARTVRRGALLAALVAAAVPARAAWFHLSLEKSEPAKGASVTALPTEIRLWFTAEPNLRLSRLTLTGPGGAVQLGKPTRADSAKAPVVFPVTGTGQAGSYKAAWVTAGKDGHPIRGEFSFTVAP
jgi:methionine-rich copper-binding protein CopC